MRAPVNLSRLRFDRDSRLLVYEPKSGHELDDNALVESLEFLARVLIHIPEPSKHLVYFYGAYANRVRHRYRDQACPADVDQPSPTRRALNRRWAELIYRIYEVDPLTCRRCGEKMELLAFIIDPAVIRHILDHLERKARARPRAPPESSALTIV